MNTNRIRIAALVMLAGAAPSLAQDSTAKTGSTSDALNPYSTTLQRTNYVVDLGRVTSSWGITWGIAPIAKSSKSSVFFSNSFLNAQGISRETLNVGSFAAGSYAAWAAAGAGVSPTDNDAPGTVSSSGLSGKQMGWLFAEANSSSASDNANYDAVIAGVINYDPGAPSRLYVSRINAAIDGTTTGESFASFGAGSVDANANAHFRADNFAATGANPLQKKNAFRVRALNRNTATLNTVSQLGGSDAAATNWLVQNFELSANATDLSVPTIIPQSIAGRPVLLTSRFDKNYWAETTAGVMGAPTATHRPGTNDHRGALSYSRFNFAGFASATSGMSCTLVKPDADTLTRGISVWGLDANGNVTNTRLIQLPTSAGQINITDNDTGLNTTTVYPATTSEFDHYRSLAGPRGGNGQPAIGTDQAGNLIASAVVYGNGTGNGDAQTFCAVAKSTPAGTTTWTLAGYVYLDLGSGLFVGKPIVDGSGTPIGQMTALTNVTGGIPFGPSMSAPAIDSVGNVWFITAAELYNRLPDGSSDFDNVLVRAVYNPATFSYKLEKVLELGDEIFGPNSGTNYQIRFLSIATTTSTATIGTVSPSTLWSQNVNQDVYGNADRSTLSTRDPRTLGGLVLNASIVYDTNNDGDYDTALGDQSYQALMFIGGSFCKADWNGDGSVDDFDFFDFLNDLNLGTADYNGDTSTDDFDFFDFLNDFNAGC
ncbi:MAG: hypothetical protein JNM07_06205 [Phycisphaerae bacterium]|nr:hypothetical protein [Phycisphaerae bacterium]